MVPHEDSSLFPRSAGDAAADDAPLDLAASAALIETQRARVAAATDLDARLLFGVWGAAWLVGFAALYAVALDPPLLGWPAWSAGALFAALLVAAMVVTAVHIASRSKGVRGVSSRAGAMYGWGWGLSFGGVAALGSALARAGASAEVMQLVMTVVPALLVGALYMVGAAMSGSRTQFALGAWIAAVTIVAATVGAPGILAVMSVAGGGGMLVGAVLEQLRRRRMSPRADR